MRNYDASGRYSRVNCPPKAAFDNIETGKNERKSISRTIYCAILKDEVFISRVNSIFNGEEINVEFNITSKNNIASYPE